MRQWNGCGWNRAGGSWRSRLHQIYWPGLPTLPRGSESTKHWAPKSTAKCSQVDPLWADAGTMVLWCMEPASKPIAVPTCNNSSLSAPTGALYAKLRYYTWSTFWDSHSAHATGPQYLLQMTTLRATPFKKSIQWFRFYNPCLNRKHMLCYCPWDLQAGWKGRDSAVS